MGSFLSAILAGATVAVAEHRFYANIPRAVGERVLGCRCADDGLAAIVEWDGVCSATEIFQQFEAGCYPKPLELEVEYHDGRFDLLESEVRLGGDEGAEVVVVHKVKNWKSWWKTGKGRFRVWTGRGSWGEKRGAILVGLLLRANSNCSQQGGIFLFRMFALLRACVDAEQLGQYRKREVLSAIRYVERRGGPGERLGWWFLAECLCGHRTVLGAYHAFWVTWMGVLDGVEGRRREERQEERRRQEVAVRQEQWRRVNAVVVEQAFRRLGLAVVTGDAPLDQ